MAMAHPLRRLLLLSCGLAATAPALHAQHEAHEHDCTVLCTSADSARLQRLFAGARRADTKSWPAGTHEKVEAPIRNSGEVYQFRLALCITPEVLDEFYDGGQFSKQKVYDWWRATEAELNTYYRRDVGIELKMIIDDRLIMFENNTGFDIRVAGTPNALNGTPIISALIGADSYDVGVLITKSTSSLAGQASLGGAASPSMKGNAFAMTRVATIAHEMGHLFGAQHTHVKSDADYTEPGSGRSLMSYGSPRDFFSLSSVRAMRNLLHALNVYTDEARTPALADYSRNSDTEGTNMPYAYAESGEQPTIDRDLLAREYVVTKGSKFQFQIPLRETHQDDVYYTAHGMDFGSDLAANALQPVYKPTTSASQMFQPRYRSPLELAPGSPESQYLEPYSGDSRVGLFTFVVAAHDHSLYDSEKVRLRIVEGDPFTASIAQPTNATLYRWGRKMEVQWTPLTQFYGTDSRIRILLSTDYGQTFPYILADDVPNTGSWLGAFPYITIGRTDYPGYGGTLGGGVVKVEVKGEAAYDVAPSGTPYYWDGSAYVYTGGFTIDSSNARYLFREVATGNAAPEPYVHLASADLLPAMPQLEAYRSTNTSQVYTAVANEVREGCLVRRTWTATISGEPYTYTQIFELPAEKAANAAALNRARNDAREAKELIDHEGEAGYPKPSLEAFQTLKSLYTAVYTPDGQPRTSLTTADAQRLADAIDALRACTDADITYPAKGTYLLRSYQALPATTPYYYYHRDVADEQVVETWTTDEATATPLTLDWSGDALLLHTTAGDLPYLDGMTNTYADFQLRRGFEWGSFTLLSHSLQQAMLSRNGHMFSLNHRYADDPIGYLCNNNSSMIVSTDFQFVALSVDEQGTPTGIGGISSAQSGRHTHVFDLSGRRVSRTQSGIYIVNGQKILVR